MTSTALETRSLTVGYGREPIVRDVNVRVPEGETVCIIGPNGAGKSSVLKGILGLNRTFHGSVMVSGRALDGMRTHQRIKCGIGYVPQGRQVFPDLTVRENIQMGGFLVDDRSLLRRRVADMEELFPRLGERASQPAGLLSGGEQQMLAMARALVVSPHVVILDEPTLGLAPVAVADVVKQLKRMQEADVSILIVEQNATLALKHAHGAFVIDRGTSSEYLRARDVLESADMQRLYLGG